jgi:hypothetical protein
VASHPPHVAIIVLHCATQKGEGVLLRKQNSVFVADDAVDEEAPPGFDDAGAAEVETKLA